MKRFIPIYAIALIAIITVLFIVMTVELNPPNDTRMILEHTHRTYISPPCFEQAETTNNLAETTLVKALDIGYAAESDCTKSTLQPIRVSLFDFTRIKIGLSDDPWDW